MRRILSLTLVMPLTFALSGCGTLEPCGWDEDLVLGASYDIELIEKYSAESTTAVYLPELDLTHPVPTCDGLPDIFVGDTLRIRTTGAPNANRRCSTWRGKITSPPLELGTPRPVFLNARSYNQLIASGVWDFGDGCGGGWEFSVHAPEDRPFRPQSPSSIPVVVGYRVMWTGPNAACSALVGREPEFETDEFRCGDAYVVTMSPVVGR